MKHVKASKASSVTKLWMSRNVGESRIAGTRTLALGSRRRHLNSKLCDNPHYHTKERLGRPLLGR